MKKLYIVLIMAFALMLCLGMTAFANEAVPENYVEDDSSYTVYTDAQYTEVITGVMNGTLTNKTIVLGCDIKTVCDLVMNVACDITIDLNTYALNNTYVSNKSGDFDLQNENAIIRVKNGKMTSTFCMFIFRNSGQVYLENVDIVSSEECFYRYGGHSGVISLKNTNIDIKGAYSSMTLSDCGGKGGVLYQIEGGRFDGLDIHCPREGSYIKDCVVYDRELKIDAWHTHGEGNTDVIVEFTNVESQVKTYLNDSRVDPVFYDSTLGTVQLTRDNQLIVAYTSATCTEAGTKMTYTGPAEAAVGTADEQYSIDNPAKGHTADLGKILDLVYENGFISNGTYICSCTACDATDVKEKTPSALPLISFVGISTSQVGNGICVGYSLNNDAINEYKSYEKTFEYGIVAYVPLEGEASLEPINNDLSSIERTISCPLSTTYTSVDFVLKGFSESTYNLPIVMSAYVYDGTEVDYINVSLASEKPVITQDDYASTITYNDVE